MMYSKADIGLIKKHFNDYTDKQFAKMFNTTVTAFQQKRRKLGLLRDPNANTGRFSKGNAPVYINKKANKGSFKKGEVPHNTKVMGSISKRSDGYSFIKTEHGWKLYHRYIFETYFGEIPKGSVVVFKDKNKDNFSIENLECITLQENRNRNINIKKAAETLKNTWEFAKQRKQKGHLIMWYNKKQNQYL